MSMGSGNGGVVPTRDYITYRAGLNPDDLAVAENGRDITFGEFDRDLERFVAAVGELGLTRSQSVAVECTGFYLHWLLLLAFEAHGIATFSYKENEIPDFETMIADVDLVLCNPDGQPEMAKRTLPLTPEWVDAAFAHAPD
jgi:non-ribosomal peptide synthetase component E (peptide arylation enzyme)